MGRGTRSQRTVSRAERRETQRDASRRKYKEGYGEIIPFEKNGMKPLKPLTDNQRRLISTIRSSKLTFATGVAGSGKTAIAIGVALEMLLSGEIEQIILTTAEYSIDSQYAPVPGDENEKYAHVFRPMRENFKPFISPSHLEYLEKNGKVKFEVLGNILGLNFHNSFIIFDEAQCSTQSQMKALLTRMGKNSKAVLAGDFRDQAYMGHDNGLEDIIYRMRDNPHVGRVDFRIYDIVRDEFVRDVILAYRDPVDDISPESD